MRWGIDSKNRVWNWVAKLRRLAGRYDNPMATWFLAPITGIKLPTQEPAEIETGMAEKSCWDQANRRQKLSLVWRNRKKISQIIKDYFYLPFFLLIILCIYLIFSERVGGVLANISRRGAHRRHLSSMGSLGSYLARIGFSEGAIL